MKFPFVRGRTVAALVGFGLAVTGCTSGDPAPDPAGDASGAVGSVELGLALSPEATVNRIDYQIMGNGILPISGSIDVSATGSDVSLLVGDLPVGTYTIEMSATATDGATTCRGSASVAITAGANTSVTVILQCTGPSTTGDVLVNATTNSCPRLAAVTFAPRTVALGGRIAVTASATDPDPGATLAYSWSATAGGSFADPAAASTTFTCEAIGIHGVKVAVTDGQCSKDVARVVLCLPAGPVFPADATRAVFDDRGDGFPRPLLPGAECRERGVGRFIFTVANRRLAWHVCRLSNPAVPSSPLRFFDGIRELNDLEFTRLTTALGEIVVAPPECVADVPTRLLEVTNPAGVGTYVGRRGDCFLRAGGPLPVAGMDPAIELVNLLAR